MTLYAITGITYIEADDVPRALWLWEHRAQPPDKHSIRIADWSEKPERSR